MNRRYFCSTSLVSLSSVCVCVCVCACVCVLVTQSGPTLCDSMACNLLGSSVHGILWARILGWVAIPFSRGSSWPRDRTQVSHISGRFFTIWNTYEFHYGFWKQWQSLFSWAPKSLQMVTAAVQLKDACSLKENYDQPRQHIKKQRHYFANKGPSSQSYGFSSSHVWMWELDHKESWVPKNWCFWTVVLKTLESPLDWKIKPVNPKGNHSWIFIGRTDTEAEAPILWPPDAKNWLIGKDPDVGKDWLQEEKGTTEDEMVWWHQRLDGHEFEQAPGVGDGQGSLACCNSWGHKELDMT